MKKAIIVRSARLVCALSGLLATGAHAQVIEAGYPTSILRTLNADNGWAGWGPNTFGYGAGTNSHGSSGLVTHTYDSFSNLESIRIGISELRNLGAGPVAINNPSQMNFGQVQFTPQVALPYEITGRVTMVMTGLDGSFNTANGWVKLEEAVGPWLANYSGSMTRTGAVSTTDDLFDASSPWFGASTGMLSAGVTYRLSWHFEVSTEINGDDTAYANIFALDGPSFVQIAFTPAPASASLLVLGVLASGRRRRSAH